MPRFISHPPIKNVFVLGVIYALFGIGLLMVVKSLFSLTTDSFASCTVAVIIGVVLSQLLGWQMDNLKAERS